MPEIVASTETQSNLKTPFALYVGSQTLESDCMKLRLEYDQMSIDEKYEWIEKAVRLAPECIKKILTKEEQRIHNGQITQPVTAYNLFVKDMYERIKLKTDKHSEVFSKIAQSWRILGANKKKKYMNAAAAVSQFDCQHILLS